MAKQIPDLTQLLPADLTADDLLVVRDVSANKDKKIRVGDVTGMPAIGWIAALETWTFASYANGVGVVNIPSGGLTKYAIGMKVQFSQTTGGKKYAIVTGVTNTTLTLSFLLGATLANEGIATPQYSTEAAPPTSDNVDWTTFRTPITKTIDNVTFNPGNSNDNTIGLSTAVSVGSNDKLKIQFDVVGSFPNAGTGFHYRLYKDGSQFDNVTAIQPVTTGVHGYSFVTVDSSPGAGGHTYEVRLAGAGSTTPNVTLKRAGLTVSACR